MRISDWSSDVCSSDLQLVDEHPLRRVREGAALAPAALLGGAGLVVDDGADAFDFAQLLLDGVEPVAMVALDARRELRPGRIFVRLVGDDRDALQIGIAACRESGC